jgi:hypothetical protein
MSIRFARSSICSRLKNVPSPAPGQVSQIFFHDDGLSRCEFQNGQVRHWTGLALYTVQFLAFGSKNVQSPFANSVSETRPRTIRV